MEKRQISKENYSFLKDELFFIEKQGVITTEKVEAILSLYGAKKRISFLRVLVIIGALLIGVGILSFIAGNWDLLPKTVKLLFIIVGFVGFYLSGWKMESNYPKTSRSLYYAGVFMYGGGIFLVGQMFHLTSDPGNAFGFWALGILPLAIYLRDKWLGLSMIMLMSLYAPTIGENADITKLWPMLIAIPIIYRLNYAFFAQSKSIFFFQNLFTVYTLCITLDTLDLAEKAIPIVIFIIGVSLLYLPLPQYQQILQWQGALFYGVSGIILTIPDYWSFLMKNQDSEVTILSTLFTILFVFFLFYLLKQGHLAAILIICSLILRFYVDLSYDFLPKSLFFVVGGLMLIGFGYWFEKNRRKGKQSVENS